jgi:hypothetical protein
MTKIRQLRRKKVLKHLPQPSPGTDQEVVQGQLRRETGLPEGRNPRHSEAQVSAKFQTLPIPGRGS